MFQSAHAAEGSWRDLVDRCLAELKPSDIKANLGFLYVTEALAPTLGEILDRLRAESVTQRNKLAKTQTSRDARSAKIPKTLDGLKVRLARNQNSRVEKHGILDDPLKRSIRKLTR